MAFQYLKDNAPEHIKEDARGAWNVAVMGRFKAFKNWVTATWTGESHLNAAIGEYEDFLAMFGENDTTKKPSFRVFYEATRAPADTGNFKTFQLIMNRMGHVAEKPHYIQIRQEGRQTCDSGSFFGIGDISLQQQNAKVYAKVVDLETHLRKQAAAGDPLSFPKDKRFEKDSEKIQIYQLAKVAANIVGIVYKK